MLFRKRIERRCAYCARAGRASDGEMVCLKKGLVPADGACHRFSYDPLKRVPSRARPREKREFRPEDFQL